MRSLARNKKVTKTKRVTSPRRKRSSRQGAKRSQSIQGAKHSDITMAWTYGRRAARDFPLADGEDLQQHVQQLWVRDSKKIGSGNKYLASMKAFIDGYFSTKPDDWKPDWVLLPSNKKVAAVVMAMNEEQSITSAIQELERMPLHEIIVVVNGSTDSSFQMARSSEKAIILHFNEALGHDVGRAIGAKVTTADIVLFVDADIPVSADQLVSFVIAANRGVDVALNDLSRYVGKFSDWDEVTILKDFLNRSNHRHDLFMNSMTAVPHALTRRAIETIGFANLAVPPKAQAIALKKGLRVGTGGSVNVFRTNRHRRENIGISNPISKLIMGDHLEALGWAMQEGNPRLKYVDYLRRRDRVAGADKYNHPHL
ncbi:glycosyltransferase family 2 protein [Paenibacillus sp. YAF4_2]|uniref:glycosyltransferase family 2 protein n=1 Tax=Paenibacillus sp. YAF4_2 TaxID=3233085 RepID=UPI003F9B1F1D